MKGDIIMKIYARTQDRNSISNQISKFLGQDIWVKIEMNGSLYGAKFDCGISKKGDIHVIRFYGEIINQNFIKEDKNINIYYYVGLFVKLFRINNFYTK